MAAPAQLLLKLQRHFVSHGWNGLTSGEIMKNGGLNPEKHTQIWENHQTIEILMEKSSINEGFNGNMENYVYK